MYNYVISGEDKTGIYVDLDKLIRTCGSSANIDTVSLEYQRILDNLFQVQNWIVNSQINRPLWERTITISTNELNDNIITIPFYDNISITSVKYYDNTDTLTELGSSKYELVISKGDENFIKIYDTSSLFFSTTKTYPWEIKFTHKASFTEIKDKDGNSYNPKRYKLTDGNFENLIIRFTYLHHKNDSDITDAFKQDLQISSLSSVVRESRGKFI